MITIRFFAAIILFGFLSISGCNLERVEATPPQLTTTISYNQLSTPDRDFHPVSNPTSESPVTTEPCGLDDHTLTRHIVVADVDYTAHSVNVQQRIHVANNSDNYLEQIVINVEPNHWRGIFTLGQITIDEQEPEYTLQDKNLTIILPEELSPSCEVAITLNFSLNIPTIGAEGNSAKGFLGQSNRQLNLGYWLATVTVLEDGEWISHDASLVGEYNVLDKADWDVTVNLISPPTNLIIAAPGIATEINGNSWRYTHNGSRDFTMSLSNKFNVGTQVTESGVMVEVYSFNNARNNNAAAHALDVAARSLEMYGDLFGAYPYERMLVVQGDFPDGMEFSGLVFVGNYWFARYEDDPASYLTLITVHEVSHQWWYALIGNNSAMHPWLDEAFATYSEYIFLEEYYPDLRDWWWEIRVEMYSPQGYVDGAVYEFDTNRAYINAVYLRGAQMLHSLRGDLGTDAFFRLLADYAQAGNGTISTPELFWSLLTTEQFEATSETRETYFDNP